MQKQFNLFMVLGFVVFTAIFVFLLIAMNPDKGLFAVVSFYLSLSFAIICLGSLVGHYFRKKATNNEMYYGSIRISMREAFLAALFVDGLLALGKIRLLTWWDATLLAATIILLELYLLSSGNSKKLKRDEEIIL